MTTRPLVNASVRADSHRWRLWAEVDRRPFLRTGDIPDAPHRDDCACWRCGGTSLTAPPQHYDCCVCWTCDPQRWAGVRRRRLLHALRQQRDIYDAQNSRIGVYDLLPYVRAVGLDWLIHPGS